MLNLGAGVQSTTLYLMFASGDVQPGIEKIAIFADTGEEPAARLCAFELAAVAEWPPIVCAASAASATISCWVAIRPAGASRRSRLYTAATEGDKAGMVRPPCTKEYKIDVIERYIRREFLVVGSQATGRERT